MNTIISTLLYVAQKFYLGLRPNLLQIIHGNGLYKDYRNSGFDFCCMEIKEKEELYSSN